MALLEIITADGQPMEFSFSRGNGGALVDIQGGKLNEFALPSLGGGGGVYPSEADVEDGVEYGPTGNDFSGNLVLPLEANVEAGVLYGAGGTEFEGELIGSSEHSVVF